MQPAIKKQRTENGSIEIKSEKEEELIHREPRGSDDPSRKYWTTIDKLKATLEQYGVAILPSVLDAKECAAMIDGMWNYLEHVSARLKPSPISRNDPTTWKQMQHLYPLHWMLLKQFGIGHTQMSWNLRQNPKVMAPFAKLWSVEQKDLLTSFDGASFHMPPEVTGAGWNRNGHSWWHTDQNYKRNGFECVQSWVTAVDTSEGDATLAVLEGSHKYHAEFNQQFGVTERKDFKPIDWYKLSNDEEVQWYQITKNCRPVYIRCPAGSMVFWDSRTIHYGREAVKGRTTTDHIRCIAYLCMTPRSLCSESMLTKRMKAFEDLRTTSHWPHKMKLNPTKPRTYGKPLQEIVPIVAPTLSAVGRRLVGY
jgi:hypothetical protein